MKKSIIILSIIMASFYGFSQNLTVNNGEVYKFAKLTDEKGETFEVKNLKLSDDLLTYYKANNDFDQLFELKLSEIERIELPIGDKKKKGMLIGAGVGLGVGAIPLIIREIQIAKEEDEYGYTVTGGEARYLMPVAGAIIGFGIGALVGKAKKIAKGIYKQQGFNKIWTSEEYKKLNIKS